MRLSVLALLAACGSASNPSSPPVVAADEVATPTEQAAAAPPTQAVTQAVAPAAQFPETCHEIAKDIEKLARQYPQLIDFRAVDQKDCTIRYEYRTHRPTTRGGWSSGVPHPDADGIWFYIGIYDPNGPDAQSQIHTQPVVPNWWIGSRKVMYLILEGTQTKSASATIAKILERHGMQTR